MSTLLLLLPGSHTLKPSPSLPTVCLDIIEPQLNRGSIPLFTRENELNLELNLNPPPAIHHSPFPNYLTPQLPNYLTTQLPFQIG